MQFKRMVTILRGALIGAALLPALASAQPATPRVDQRQANQERRIEQGVQSGELTKREAARLERGQERVEKMEAKAKEDGTVTAEERKRLKRAQDRQSGAIYKEKHDRQADRDHDGRKDRPARKQ
jgi:hypothetical protein